jgi:hypothetical protein
MPTPDHVPCRHCGQSISWDEICWTHDNSGFADCGVTIRGGIKFGSVTIDPEVIENPEFGGKRAEPVGQWS